MEELQEIKNLCKQMKEGNIETCFSKFYAMTKQKVYYAGKPFLKDDELLLDCMQETYVDFLKQLPTLKDGEDVVAYLCQMMRNKAKNLYKKMSRSVYADEYENEALYGELDESHHDIVEEMRKITTPIEFEILFLHLVEDMTFKDIAKRIHRPLGTTLWIYNKAIKKLQERMRDDHE